MSQNLVFPELSTTEMNTEVGKVKKALKVYYETMINSNIEQFREIWHSDAKRIGLGNSNELYCFPKEDIIKYSLIGLKNARESVPGFNITFKIKKIKHIDVHDVIASAEVEWEMIMPDSEGHHCSYFHFVKEKDQWIIVGLLDRGMEKKI